MHLQLHAYINKVTTLQIIDSQTDIFTNVNSYLASLYSTNGCAWADCWNPNLLYILSTILKHLSCITVLQTIVATNTFTYFAIFAARIYRKLKIILSTFISILPFYLSPVSTNLFIYIPISVRINSDTTPVDPILHSWSQKLATNW